MCPYNSTMQYICVFLVEAPLADTLPAACLARADRLSLALSCANLTIGRATVIILRMEVTKTLLHNKELPHEGSLNNAKNVWVGA